MKSLSVCILNWNQSDVTLACIKSLQAILRKGIDQVIVFDNGSNFLELERLKAGKLNLEFSLIENGVNCGVSGGRNRIVSTVHRDSYVMILDNDTICDVESFEGRKLFDVVDSFFSSHPKVGVLGFRLLNEDKSRQDSCRRFPSILQPFASRIKILQKFTPFSKEIARHLMQDVDFSDPYSINVQVDYVLGTNQIYKKELFESIGGYSKDIFYGPEDALFCLQAIEKGYKNYYCSEVSFFHLYRRIGKSSIKFFVHGLMGFLHFYKVRGKWGRIKPNA